MVEKEDVAPLNTANGELACSVPCELPLVYPVLTCVLLNRYLLQWLR